MTRYLLDTNAVSHLLRGNTEIRKRLISVPMETICISAVTEGELRYGLARRPEATRLHAAVHELLLRLEVLPWDGPVATRYGNLRAELERIGRTLSPLDLMIAAHASAENAVLVSNDQAFSQMPGLRVEDWTR